MNSGDIDQEQLRADRKAYEDAYSANLLRAMKSGGNAERDFFESALEARESIRTNCLLPGWNEDGHEEYHPQQAYRAACHGREDVVTITNVQLRVLQRLDRLSNLLWLVVVLLFVLIWVVPKK